MTTKKETMSDKIFKDSIELDYQIFEKTMDLIIALKKHKISNWKTKNNEHALIIEVDQLLTAKHEHNIAWEIVEEIEKNEA